MKFKGPAFPSWDAARPRYTPKLVRDYRGRPPSLNKQLRTMRVTAREVIDSKDPQVISVGDKVIRLCLDEPNPEFSALHLICAGLAISKDVGEPWTACMLTILAKYEDRMKEPEDATPTPRDPNHSRLRGLLRALVPRSLRERYEGSAVADQHHITGDGNGECTTGEGTRISGGDPEGDAADHQSGD